MPGAAFREDATDEEIAAALRDRFFGRTSCARRVRELGRPKTPKVGEVRVIGKALKHPKRSGPFSVPQRCSLRVGVFNGGVDWADKSEPINLPLGYTRRTYKAELARRRIYANWGKTT